MTITKMYKYIGLNGTITSKVFLPDAKAYEIYSLKADEGKLLTNGIITTGATTASPDKVSTWYEIEETKDDND